MTHVIETAPTGRAKCRGCGERIAVGALRFGEVGPNPFGEGESTQWFHPECAAFKRPEAFLEGLASSAEALPDREALEAEAQRGIEHARLVRVNGAERAPTGRAQCRACKATIDKAAWRIVLTFHEEGRFMPGGFVHAGCAAAYFETADVLARVRRFSPALGEADLAELQAQLTAPGA